MFNQFFERFGKGLQKTKEDLRFSSPVLQLAMRSAFACTLATFISLLFHVHNPYWSAISAMTVMVANTGSSIQKSILRMLGTIIGAALALLVIILTHQDPIIYCLLLALGSMIGIYFTTVDKEHFYAWLLGIVAYCMILLSPLAHPSPTQYIDTAYFRCLEILIGIGSATFVQHLIFPKRASDELEKHIHQTAVKCESILLHYKDCLFDPSKIQHDQFTEETKACRSDIEKLSTLWAATAHETFFHKSDFKRQGQLLRAISNMLELIVTNYRELPSTPSPYWQEFKEPATALLNHSHHIFKLLIQTMHNGGQQSDEALTEIRKFKAEWIKLKKHFAKLRKGTDGENIHLKYKVDEVDTVLASLSVIRLSVYEFEHALDVDTKKNENIYKPKRIGLYRSLVEYDGYYLKFAIVATLGVLIGPFTWLFFGLPGYSQIAISVAAVIGLNPEATRYKGLLRISACFVGCIAVVGILGINIESTSFLLIILFAVSTLFLFFHYSNADVSYFGTQANVVLFIGVVYQFMPDQSMAHALQRLFGIVSGVCILVIFQQLFWSYHPKDRVIHHIRQLQKSWYASLHALVYNLSSDSKSHHVDIAQRLFKKIPTLRHLLQIADDEKYTEDVHELYFAARDSLRHIYTLNLIAINMPNPDQVEDALPHLSRTVADIAHLSCISHHNSESIQTALAAFEAHLSSLNKTRLTIRQECLLSNKSIAAAFDVYVFLHHLRQLCRDQIKMLNKLNSIF